MNSHQRILVFATQFMPTGGIESHLLQFCYQLALSGVDVDLLVLNSCMSKETETQFRSICGNVMLGHGGSSLSRMLWLGYAGLICRLRGYRALYTNGQGSSINFLSRVLGKSCGWIHHHHTSGNEGDRFLWPTDYRKAILRADKVVACSQRSADEMSGILGREIITVPCFSTSLDSVKSRLDTGEPDRVLNFGYFGRFIPEKGIDMLCRLSDDPEIRGIRFHLWGEGEGYPPSFFKAFEAVEFHGAFSGRKGLEAAVATLDGFLLISEYPEGLPISLLEVMSGGIPWIASNQGGIPDIACDPLSTRVLVDPKNYQEVKETILSLAEDIRSGLVTSDGQKALYNEYFKADILVTRWCETLSLRESNSKTPVATEKAFAKPTVSL